jgi:hypothetical protein
MTTPVTYAEALRLMKTELDKIDSQFATQFNTFKNNILTLDRNVTADQATFNSSRRQSIDPSVAVGGNYYGRQYERRVGGRLGATHNENEFAYSSGVSRYV